MTKPEKVKISFYKIQKCGYYGIGDAAPKFGNLQDLLSQLKTWSVGLPLASTKMLDPKNTGHQSSYPIYLFGIAALKDDWVIATWNEVASTDGTVASVNMHDAVGAAKVHENQIVKNSIPGFATYFWFPANTGLMATIRFQHPNNGHGQLQQYFKDFMATHTSYVVVDDSKPGIRTVVGYSNEADNTLKKVQPRFKTTAFVKDGELDVIRSQHANIRQVVRRGHLTIQKQLDKEFWQKAIRYIRGSSNASNSHFVKQKAYVELEYTPTLAELNTMIDAELNDFESSGWDDLGFMMKGESNKIHWVGRSSAVGDFMMNVNRTNTETVDLKSLLTSLNQQRADIMSLLQ